MNISVNFSVQVIEKDGYYNCYIPEIDSYYCSKTIEGVEKLGSGMIKSFISFYEKQNSNKDKESTQEIFNNINNPNFDWEEWFRKYK